METHNYRTYDLNTDTEKYNFPSPLPNRPGANTTGKAIQIRLNQFKVNSWTNKDIHQYDVSS
jgi:eukaryotic translation initiation factor 2C